MKTKPSSPKPQQKTVKKKMKNDGGGRNNNVASAKKKTAEWPPETSTDTYTYNSLVRIIFIDNTFPNGNIRLEHALIVDSLWITSTSFTCGNRSSTFLILHVQQQFRSRDFSSLQS